MTLPNLISIAAANIAKTRVLRINFSDIIFSRSLFPEAEALAVSLTMIPDMEHSTTEGKNIVGITIASKIPNLLKASLTESPYCRKVTGIRASFVLLSAEVIIPPPIMGRAKDMYFLKVREDLPEKVCLVRAKTISINARDMKLPEANPDIITPHMLSSEEFFIFKVIMTMTADFTAKSRISAAAVTEDLRQALKYPLKHEANALVISAAGISFIARLMLSL